jgi:zinc transport system substrate-binding protein
MTHRIIPGRFLPIWTRSGRFVVLAVLTALRRPRLRRRQRKNRFPLPGGLSVAVLAALLLSGCMQREPAPSAGKLSVTTTLFPLYDFVRQVGGDRVEARLLLPPGVEPHVYEPTPEDIVRVSKAAVFVYTNRFMEPWATEIVNSVGGGAGPLVIDASAGVRFLPRSRSLAGKTGRHEGEGGGHAEAQAQGADPHIWLSIPNAATMVENIAAGLMMKDPENKSLYERNAKEFRARLDQLDRDFREGLAVCKTRMFLHGGHFAFAYLADRYGLTYRSAYPVTAEAEPTPRTIMELITLMRKNSLRYIFYEELITPRTATVIAEETGATLLMLHGIHNVSREELDGGATYLSLMHRNLEHLRKGLQCR